MIYRLASVIFSIEPDRYGVDPKDDEAVTELLRSKLECQPFLWELQEYSLDEDIGTEIDGEVVK